MKFLFILIIVTGGLYVYDEMPTLVDKKALVNHRACGGK